MTTSYEKLRNIAIPDVEQSYDDSFSMLYALSLGIGTNPLSATELPYVYEKGLRALPTMGAVLGHPGFWVRDLDTGLDWVRIVHASQDLIVHAPLPPVGDVVGSTRVTDIFDKGPEKGLLVVSERTVRDKASGQLFCTNRQTMLCRGDGGIGGDGMPPASPAIPDRAPDRILERSTLPQAALLYRLVADRNPLHADPVVAVKAGFPRPILHGLATYGIACAALLQDICDSDPTALAAFSGRFTAPVFPGDRLVIEAWDEGETLAYRVMVPERQAVALDNGRLTLRK